MPFSRSQFVLFAAIGLYLSINSSGFAAQQGLEPLCTIEFSTSPLRIPPSNVSIEKFLQIAGQHLFFQFGKPVGNYIQIYDLSNPTSPTTCAIFPAKYHFQVCQNRLIVESSETTMTLFDISNPAAPRFLSTLITDCPGNFQFTGDRLYKITRMGNRTNRMKLEIWDLANPSRPILCGILPDVPEDGLAVLGKTVFLSDAGTRKTSGYLAIIDAADPRHPQKVSRIEANGWDLQLSGSLLFDQTYRFGTISILDVRDLHHPVKLGNILSPSVDRGYFFKVSGSLVYACSQTAGVEVWDISNPAKPELLDRCNDLQGIAGIDVRDDLIVVYQKKGWLGTGWGGWLRLFRSHYPQKKILLPPVK